MLDEDDILEDLYNFVDANSDNGRFHAINEKLTNLSDKDSDEVLVGTLTICFPYRADLASYAPTYDRVHDILDERGADTDALVGLDQPPVDEEEPTFVLEDEFFV